MIASPALADALQPTGAALTTRRGPVLISRGKRGRKIMRPTTRVAPPVGPHPATPAGAVPLFLTCGCTALVDAADYPRVALHRWRCDRMGYARAFVRDSARSRSQFPLVLVLHRFIVDAPPRQIIDHRNRDPLDCRRANLRPVSASVSAANTRRENAGTSSRFRGVTWHKGLGRWQAIAGRVYCGVFEKEEDAARAWDAKAAELWPDFDLYNFPPLREAA